METQLSTERHCYVHEVYELIIIVATEDVFTQGSDLDYNGNIESLG